MFHFDSIQANFLNELAIRTSVFCAIVLLSVFLLFNLLPPVQAQNALLVPEKELNFYFTQGESQNKSIQVFALVNDTDIEVLPSKLSSKESMEFIDSREILINNTPNFRTQMDKGDTSNLVISVKSDKPGIYKGSLMIHNMNNNTIFDIPVNLEVSLWWPYYVGIFMAGFGASWIFGAWNRRNKMTERFSEIKETARGIEKKYNVFSGYIKEDYTYLILQEIYNKELRVELCNSNIRDAGKTVEDLSNALSQLIEKDNFDKSKLQDNASALGLLPDTFIRRITDLSSSASLGKGLSFNISAIEQLKFNYWKYIRNRPNIIVFNASAIFLGLVIALGTLFQQQSTEFLYTLGWNNVILLLAIGAGADSLKQIVEKIVYKET